MTTQELTTHTEIKEQDNSKSLLGFWIYLMTDCVVFATFFASYAVLRNSTAGGPSGSEIFNLPFILVETLILLFSSFTAGLVVLAARAKQKRLLVTWLVVTIALGSAFLAMELTEFSHLIQEGDSWRTSAFLSAYFSLVGLHGLHILAGLIWAITLLVFVFKKGISPTVSKRLGLWSLFWHFLDIIWIFIFTFVYLFGVLL